MIWRIYILCLSCGGNKIEFQNFLGFYKLYILKYIILITGRLYKIPI